MPPRVVASRFIPSIDSPAEADMQRFFRVTAPSVHRMVVQLEPQGLIRRAPGKARSITLLVSPEDLPLLR
jgi:DNA-binding MarR family transcriptional regulator